jgi:hypothetical protein
MLNQTEKLIGDAYCELGQGNDHRSLSLLESVANKLRWHRASAVRTAAIKQTITAVERSVQNYTGRRRVLRTWSFFSNYNNVEVEVACVSVVLPQDFGPDSRVDVKVVRPDLIDLMALTTRPPRSRSTRPLPRILLLDPVARPRQVVPPA